MNFHSAQFGVFLVLALVAYWSVARQPVLRLIVLLVASQYFYANWAPRFLALLWFSTILDYTCGGIVARSNDPRTRKVFLIVAIVGNIGMLGFFKYWDWAAGGLKLLLAQFGVESPVPVLGLAVPVGISFYTFGTLSYTIDNYRRVLKPARNLLDFGVFVSFFPHLVAGPILRAAQFLPQLEHPPALDRPRLRSALYRIGLGLAKKVLFADTLARLVVDPVYAEPGQYTAAMHLLAAEAFIVQVFFDFSAYCDIAIGSARLFGFELPENFDLPYQARGVRDFWRRWHMTLSTWLRDYVYFPLGGSRVSEPRVWFNLIVSMVLIGIWHGATVPWAIMGLLQGIAMALERLFERMRGGRPFDTTPARKLLSWFLTLQFVVVSYIFARSQSLEHLLAVWTDFGGVASVSPWVWVVLAAAAPGLFLPRRVLDRARDAVLALPVPVLAVGLGVVVGLVSYLNVGDTPYFYFQF